MNKKCLVITAFYSYDYNVRIKYLEEVLAEKGYQVEILSSDFDHRYKQRVSFEKGNLRQIHVPEYNKNLSFQRIYSHYYFSKGVREFCCNHHYDLIYVITPPNFLFFYLSKVKKVNAETRIIIEFEDLWPETLPAGDFTKMLLAPVFAGWRLIRKGWVNCADGYVFECNMFMQAIRRELNPAKPKDYIYLTREDDNYKIPLKVDDSVLNFLYLGTIGNLIDINLIVNFLSKVNTFKSVNLHIIGGGEKKDVLIKRCENSNIKYYDYGLVFENKYKTEIIEKCDFALNIMKQSVFVGATMKSLEYFHYGLALINNIEGDSKQLVETSKCGFNLSSKNIFDVANRIARMNSADIFNMRKRSQQVYKEHFSSTCFRNKFSLFLDKVMS